jgi:ABC-type transport system substrate-binding protein
VTWTLKLVPNAKWQAVPTDAIGYSDALKPLYGRPFTANDVVHTIKYWLGQLTKPDGKPQGTPANVALSNVDSVTAVDATTVALKLKAPNPRIPYVLADFQLRVMSPEVFNLDGDYTKHVVGTGAFFLNKFAADGRNSEFGANSAYFRNGGDGKPLPYLDKWSFQVIQDTALAYSAVKTGALHSHQSIGVNTPSDARRFAGDCPTCQIAQVYSAQGVFGVGFKTEGAGAPFADPRARLAFAKAIDWKTLIQNRYEGAAILAPAANATAMVFDQLPTLDTYVKFLKDNGISDDENPYVFNPTLAKQLWAASGHKPGETISMLYTPLYGGTIAPDFQAIAGLVSQNLGIEVKLDPKADFPSYYSAVGYQGGQPHQQFSGLSLYFNTLYPDNAQSIFNQFTPGQQANFMEFNDPQVTALAAEIFSGVPLAREKEITKAVVLAEHKGNNFRRIVLPTPARFSTYNGAVRNMSQQSRGGECCHQGGNLVELIWLAR